MSTELDQFIGSELHFTWPLEPIFLAMGALSFPVWHATFVRLATRNENGFHYIVSRSQSVINNMNGTKVPNNSNEIDLSSAHTHTHQINYLMELPNALPSQTHTHTNALVH